MDGNDLKTLGFIVFALLTWVVKTVVERKEARAPRRRAQRPTPGSGAAPPPPVPDPERDDEPDVVYGRRPLPAHYTALRPSSGAAAAAPARPAAPPPPPPAGRAGVRRLGTVRDRHLDVNLKVTAAAAVRRSQEGQNARRRLGYRRLGGPRRALRTAVFWNEILGPPRALKGPHRSPAAQRRAR